MCASARTWCIFYEQANHLNSSCELEPHRADKAEMFEKCDRAKCKEEERVKADNAAAGNLSGHIT